MSQVVLLKESSYDEERVFDGVCKALEKLGGMDKWVQAGEKILIKPNLLSAEPPEKIITTHPSLIKAVIRLVQQAGGRAYIGDSPALSSFRRAALKSGLIKVAEDTGADLLEFEESREVPAQPGNIFKKLEIAREVLEMDGIINLPKLKTHSLMLLTLGVKNMFGCMVGKRKGQWHLKAGSDRFYFATMLVELYAFLKPRLTVLDGIIGMEGNGPAAGNPTNTGLIAASPDAVALDTVIARLVGAGTEQFPTLLAARMKGIGVSDLGKIEILGDSLESLRLNTFRLPRMAEQSLSSRFFTGHLKKWLTSKPVEDLQKCDKCGSCIEVCPAKVIGLGSRRLKFNYDECIRCFCCQEVCPQGAIEIKEGALLRLLS